MNAEKKYELGRITHKILMAASTLLLEFDYQEVESKTIIEADLEVRNEAHDHLMTAYYMLNKLAYPDQT